MNIEEFKANLAILKEKSPETFTEFEKALLERFDLLLIQLKELAIILNAGDNQ